jgi:hypothetical protein
MSRLLLIAVFLEVGAVLTVVPWTQQWDRNYFVETMPYVEVVASNPYVRGAVSGLGVVNLFAGITELVSLILANRSQEPTTIRSDTFTGAK